MIKNNSDTSGLSETPGANAGESPPSPEALAPAPSERAFSPGRVLAENSLAPVPAVHQLLRSLYWSGWFVVTPFVLACLSVWALAPSSGVEPSGAFGFLARWVREQPVPSGIAAFSLFEVALWALRFHLPFSAHAHPPLPPDVPHGLRGAFERARALRDEADAMFERHASVIDKQLTPSERDAVHLALRALERAMANTPFDEGAFVDALVVADGEVDIRLGRFRKSEIREYAESILIAIGVAMALRAFVVEAFKIPSGSMIPTLQIGDNIFVNKFTYGLALPYTHTRLWSPRPPDRGDVIVFAYPEHPEQDFIKRVIAIPGDTLEARGGHPILNGWEVPHCSAGLYTYEDGSRHEGELFVEFLDDEAFLTLYDRQSLSVEDEGPFVVNPGEVWVMGDNRNNSHDSRKWWGGQGGGVPFDNVKGRALFVWLSVADSFDASRIFAPVMGRPPGKGPFGALPEAMRSLEPGIETCLLHRPPLDKTTPPAPRRRVSAPPPPAPIGQVHK